ncbi:MAG: hypothetical protein U9N49_01180 [Campylobacterota bacterium]|nr:hypothetical protein [Campylobacterota bacterium]
MDNYKKMEEKEKKSREEWVKKCGGSKYIHIEDNNIILKVGTQCKHIFTFNDIQKIGYRLHDNKNIFFIFMSKNSSTNKGNRTESYFYNICNHSASKQKMI